MKTNNKQIICVKCQREILKSERACSLKTFLGDKTLEEHFWHLNCWTQWFEEKAMERAKVMFTTGIQQSMNFIKPYLNHVH